MTHKNIIKDIYSQVKLEVVRRRKGKIALVGWRDFIYLYFCTLLP